MKFWILSLLSLLLNSPSFGANTGTLTLDGLIALQNNIDVVSNGNNPITLDILRGENAKHIATAQETSNNATGYKVLISSTGNGLLKNTQSPTQATAYSISYNRGDYRRPTTAFAVVKTVASLNQTTTHSSEIHINVTPAPNARPGNYEDTITLSIEANP